MAEKVSRLLVQLQSGSDRSLVATWDWSKHNHTKHYKIRWSYWTGDLDKSGEKIWIISEESEIKVKNSTYDAPSNAKQVNFKVKPVSEYKDKKKKTVYFTADYASQKHKFSQDAPETPSAPTVTINNTKYKLTAEVTIYDSRAKKIEFEVVQDNKTKVGSGTATVTTNHASYTFTISAGHEYKVRCRAINGGEMSDWSEYSGDSGTAPSAPGEFYEYRARTSTEVYLEWTKVPSATSYVIEYAKFQRYFDSSPSNVSSVTVPGNKHHAEISGLDTGTKWWFRLQAVNESGSSGFNTPVSVILGKTPSAPTTWSLRSSVTIGETATLYWVHNSEDGSKQKAAQVEISINGSTQTYPVDTPSQSEEEKEQTYSYDYDTTGMTSGTEILWRVKTKGVLDEYSEWSIQRSIKVYAPATVGFDTAIPDTLTSYPLLVHVTASPSEQVALRFFVSIVANDAHESYNYDGTSKWIKAGEEIFGKNYYGENWGKPSYANELDITLTPADVTLYNGVHYTLTVTASMDSGMNPEISANFEVEWEDIDFHPSAEIGFNPVNASVTLVPYCESDETPLSNISLSVFRRQYDGSFVEIASGLSANTRIGVPDPHPSLDVARYRIVAICNTNGQMEFADEVYDEIEEPSVILQWDEEWSLYNPDEDIEGDNEESSMVSSLLRLPYNVDISDTYSPDASLVEYIGRNHPVSYYGTQKGVTTTWNVDIDREDMETLYALRRLAVYPGDIYVREPSGSGYWANVKVSFSSKHCDVIIPVTLNITRVEGGV